MNANEARKIAQNNIAGPVIKPFLDKIYAEIKARAAKGQFEIGHLVHVSGYMNSDIERAVQQELEGKGYIWKWHENPDPGHPCSSDYITLSWK